MREYNRSAPVSSADLAETGCFTTLRVRKSTSEHLADQSTQNFFEEVSKNIGTVNRAYYSSGSRGNAAALTHPECHPDRIGAVATLFNLAFFHDDIIDSVDPLEAECWNEGWGDGSAVDGKTLGTLDQAVEKKQIETKLMLDIIALDRDLGFGLLETWKEFVGHGAGIRSVSEFKTFDDWASYRYDGAGMPVFLAINQFSQGIKFSRDTLDVLEGIVQPIMLSVALCNDFYSFEKEFNEYIDGGRLVEPGNSIWVMMRQHSIDVRTAKELLAKEMLALEEEYKRKRTEYESKNPDLSDSIKEYLDVAEFSSGGAFYWQSFAGRYHHDSTRHEELNDLATSALKDSIRDENHASSSGEQDLLNGTRGVEKGDQINGTQDLLTSQSVLDGNFDDLTEDIVLAPFNYIRSLPSKGIRTVAIDGLNTWFRIPSSSLTPIKSIVDLLHSSSLMIDDIQDGSSLRRGKPSTHIIFGEAQTINSANFLFTKSLEELAKLENRKSTLIYNKELKNLHLGQGLDLYWTSTVECPSESSYYKMIDNKTGGMFRLLGLLMEAESKLSLNLEVESFLTLVGRYFQVRDDYQNLCSPDYTNQKGFCEDLDEGKFSLPIVHLWTHARRDQQLQLKAILQERRRKGLMTFESKRLVLAMMEETKSLTYTMKKLKELERLIDADLERIEKIAGVQNYVLRLLIERLRL